MNVNPSLMYDETSGSVAEDTVKYGLYLVVASLVPAIIAVIHVRMSKEEGEGDVEDQGRGAQLWLGAGIVLSVLFFPLVPIYFYIKLLVTSNQLSQEEIKAQKVLIDSSMHCIGIHIIHYILYIY